MNRIETRVDTLTHIALASVAAVLLGLAVVSTQAVEQPTPAADRPTVELPKVVVSAARAQMADTPVIELPTVTIAASRAPSPMAALPASARRA